MTDQTPDAAREAVAWQVVHTRTGDRYSLYTERNLAEEQQGYLARCGITETRIAELADAAAVSRARDAAWREEMQGIVSDMRSVVAEGELDPTAIGMGFGAVTEWADRIAAVLARMDTARAGGANG